MGKKQAVLFGTEDTGASKYTTAVGSPVYVPRGDCPRVTDLIDKHKEALLLRSIEAADVTPAERQFLIDAARRHAVFNYERIAEYYAHATPEMKRLMEQSALVIVDFNDAIESGYVALCGRIRSLYMEEAANAKA